MTQREKEITEEWKEKLKSIVPEEKKVYDIWKDTNDRDTERFTKLTKEEIGFNACRQEILDRIDRI